MSGDKERTLWKPPTIGQIAEVAGVGTATVDRVLNHRPGVREATRKRVVDALQKLGREAAGDLPELDVSLFCESGEAFNAALAAAVESLSRTVPSVRIRGSYVRTSEAKPSAFAAELEREGQQAHGVIVVAREHPATNRAIRKLCGQGIPVICLTTDLPNARRTAYVGNDQYAAGCVAGQLIGKALQERRPRILLVMSVPFRCQQEREMGFRRVLRTEYPALKIEERVISDEVPEHTCQQILQYFEANGVPDAIYNVAGANRGVAKALEQVGHGESCVFVGHELTPHSRQLLEAGLMDYVISHKFVEEVETALRCIRESRAGLAVAPTFSDILVHTKYNCS